MESKNHDLGDATKGECPGLATWVKPRQWCGQTVFTFSRPSESLHENGADPLPVPTLSGEMMFREDDRDSSCIDKGELCAVCGSRGVELNCQCCPEMVSICGACCLLRHVEQRYERHEPDEESERFEAIRSLAESKEALQGPSSLVLAPEVLYMNGAWNRGDGQSSLEGRVSDRIAFIDRDPGAHTIDQGGRVLVIFPLLMERVQKWIKSFLSLKTKR